MNRVRPILNRNIYDYEIELDMDDRADFDKYVLECYGLSGLYSFIKSSFLSMHKLRRNV